MQIIAKELGFEQLGSTGAAFKRAGYTTSIGVGADFENRYEARIQINFWKGDQNTPQNHKVPYVANQMSNSISVKKMVMQFGKLSMMELGGKTFRSTSTKS